MIGIPVPRPRAIKFRASLFSEITENRKEIKTKTILFGRKQHDIMTQETFTIENSYEETIEIVKECISSINGKTIIINNREISWEFEYRKQIIRCKTLVSSNINKVKIRTTANHKNKNRSYERIAINRLHSSIRENPKILLYIHKEKIINKPKNSYSDPSWYDWIPRNPLRWIVGIFFIVFIFGKFTNDESSGDNSSKNVFITQSGYYGAYTKEDFNKYVRHRNDGDMEALKQLLYSARITPIPGGREAYLVKSNFSTVKIRLKGQTTEIWTFTEAIKQ